MEAMMGQILRGGYEFTVNQRITDDFGGKWIQPVLEEMKNLRCCIAKRLQRI